MSKSTGSAKHIHKYFRMENGLWGCALPDCTHFMPHNVASQIEGKFSICWGCNDPFKMVDTSRQPDKPMCSKCAAVGIDNIDELDDYLTKRGI